MNCPRFDKKKKMKVICVTVRKITFTAKDGKAVSKSFNEQPSPLNDQPPK